ncbi:hypothetical protein M7I_0982 [Glarea lozoyensis 74030]|uniref:Uncharacterized protein n=1 Tax=Glarea lozoyensis (strain ATCC 74030 / MF5533) TaxID=1104152 RepID=H0EEU7_GLAL7|nr:hypothetical protein M7I_0982 [Glarea lozoyensis 74030]
MSSLKTAKAVPSVSSVGLIVACISDEASFGACIGSFLGVINSLLVICLKEAIWLDQAEGVEVTGCEKDRALLKLQKLLHQVQHGHLELYKSNPRYRQDWWTENTGSKGHELYCLWQRKRENHILQLLSRSRKFGQITTRAELRSGKTQSG